MFSNPSQQAEAREGWKVFPWCVENREAQTYHVSFETFEE